MTDTSPDQTRPWRLAFMLVATLTLLRIAVLFVTPLELYPDEAQYWLWSRTLDFGYFSKPPMIAWLIAATTTFGNAEPYVRLAAPLLHAGAALALFGVGRRLYGAWTGLAACAVYSLMPGVQLSSGVISTDAPLLFFLSLGLLAYVTVQTKRSVGVAAGLGAALGLAMLSKYAAAYAVGAIVLHLAVSKDARRCRRTRGGPGACRWRWPPSGRSRWCWRPTSCGTPSTISRRWNTPPPTPIGGRN